MKKRAMDSRMPKNSPTSKNPRKPTISSKLGRTDPVSQLYELKKRGLQSMNNLLSAFVALP